MSLSEQILGEVFGYSSFRPGQQDIISAIEQNKDVLAIMPTGAGKSMCYQIAGLMRPGLTVVVTPLIALMKDQVDALQANAVAAEAINSSLSPEKKREIWVRLKKGQLKLLYISPEKLISGNFLEFLAELNPTLFVIDEAHCVAQWGHDFRPDYRRLNVLKERFPAAPIAAFTATADERTRQEINNHLAARKAQVFIQGFDRPNITIEVQAKENSKQQLLSFIKKHQGQQGIIYCLSRKSVEKTAALLVKEGFNALAFHAGMSDGDKFTNQERFFAEPDALVVATIAFGMGIDKPDVRFVFHMDLPNSLEAYYQEIGRAGRDGNPSKAVLLYGLDSLMSRRAMIASAPTSDEKKASDYQKLNALLTFCEAATCRRKYLLSYFSEMKQEDCQNCDTCLSPPDVYDGTEQALLVLKTIQQTGEFFGQGHIVDVLRGSNTGKIRERQHDQLDTFGQGKNLSLAEWKTIIRQMLAADLMRATVEHNSLKISPKGRAVLKGQEPVQFIKQKKKKTSTMRSTTVPSSLSEVDGKLYQHLKAVRLKLAQEIGRPAFVVFHDRTLQELASQQPKTKQDFLAINGVGEAKFDQYGETFLRAINDFCDDAINA